MKPVQFLKSENVVINDTLAVAITHSNESQWTMLLDLNGH